ncbi:MAG: glycoside hydrolase/phage tail family protein [Devosia sp.]
MATLALSLAGQVVGGAIGGPLGATIGRALGALAGNAIDTAIFGDAPKTTGSDVRLQGSSEGAAIPRLYGWSRVSGNIIWATELERIDAATSGAKGTQSASNGAIAANFAMGLCEGEVYRLGRIWADGQLLDTAGIAYRFYRGTEAQDADSLIEAKQGTDAPAYRGLCYIVFERLPLAAFGNRIPNISVELCRVVGDLEPMIRAVTVIPGATEFGYDPVARVRLLGGGATALENAHLSRTTSDWTLSIDELCDLCPNLEHVSLVVAWFGDNLRCASCAIAPRVEAASRTVKGAHWEVAGITRASASVVSMHDDGPAYGGTPSDAAVLAAIADLKARGLAVTLYPLLLMDIPEGNPLSQPAYPWRGRISCSPGADGTGAATSEAATFAVGYRDFILHYAQLADDAGGVDALLLGSEMRGMTTVRGTADSFPFVDTLVTLAADVRAIVGPDTKLTYGADWSEYSGFQPGGGAKFFHLDPLWASSDIDAVGIDNYMPVADWRDADGEGPYDRAYLASNIAGGEGYDWYYASGADRLAGARTAITDGAYGEPWVWRFKDLANWWGNAHHDRPGGVRDTSPTAWVPMGKPIWFTELGCGAVDKGANQPNVFSDPKSAESGAPYFSNGAADPLAQRQMLRAVLGYWGDDANNPDDGAGGRMLERLYLWTWDARPFPAFPADLASWSDGANYPTGHWLTGRLGAAASDEVLRAMATDFGVSLDRVEARAPLVLGTTVDAPTTARDAISSLLAAAGLAIHDGADGLTIAHATGVDATPVADVVADEAPRISRRRPDPGEAVGQVAVSYGDRERDYLNGSVTAIGPAGGQTAFETSGLVLDIGGARRTAERLLAERTAMRDVVTFTAPPSLLALEVGDTVDVTGQDGGPFEITEIRDGLARRMTARTLAADDVAALAVERPASGGGSFMPSAEPVLAAMHLPPETTDPTHSRLGLAAYASPWPGTVTVTDDATSAALASLSSRASIGELTADLEPGAIYRWDDLQAVELTLYWGHLSSRDDDEVLAGANQIAVATDAGEWEIVGFASVELIAPQTYRLTHLLRGQRGTDFAIGTTSAGNRVVVLDGGVSLATVPIGWLGETVVMRAYAGSSDTTGTVVEEGFGLGPILPLAPVHLSAQRIAGSSDIVFAWDRRSRADADSWTPDDAPLDWSPEAYSVRIYNGVTLLRTIEATATGATYSTAQQTSDFGAPPSIFGFTVAQRSAVYGPGHAGAATFTA